MEFMKWLRWVSSMPTQAKPKAPTEPPPGDSPAAAQPEQEAAPEIDLASGTALTEAIDCARHALVMEFRDEKRFNPSTDELALWVAPIWADRDRIRAMIKRRNPMALALGEKAPGFWEALKTATIKLE